MTPKDRKNIDNTSDFENKPAVQGDSILDTEVKLTSELTCPNCAYKKEETMPTNACQWFYECEQCHTLLKPKQGGDCCIFCSYGSVKCPPVQMNKTRRQSPDH